MDADRLKKLLKYHIACTPAGAYDLLLVLANDWRWPIPERAYLEGWNLGPNDDFWVLCYDPDERCYVCIDGFCLNWVATFRPNRVTLPEAARLFIQAEYIDLRWQQNSFSRQIDRLWTDHSSYHLVQGPCQLDEAIGRVLDALPESADRAPEYIGIGEWRLLGYPFHPFRQIIDLHTLPRKRLP